MAENQSDLARRDRLTEAHEHVRPCISGIEWLWTAAPAVYPPKPLPGFHRPKPPVTGPDVDELNKAVRHLASLVSDAREKLGPVEDKLTEVASSTVGVHGVYGPNAHSAILNLAEDLLRRRQRITTLDLGELNRVWAKAEREYQAACRAASARVGPGKVESMALPNRALDRFPLLGEIPGIPFNPPRDADWLPKGWQHGVYPKWKREDGEDRKIEAILQYLDRHIWSYEECLIPLLDAGVDEKSGTTDRGGPVRNAYRLANHLREERSDAAKPPPREPSREYRHYRGDLEAVVAELRKVREWVDDAGERPKTLKESSRPKESRSTKPPEAETKRGRPVDKLTIQRRKFAKPLREEGKTWEEIAVQYSKKYRGDLEASADTIRLAVQREES